MHRMLRWLLPARRRRPALTCYLRENGPIAYESNLFGASPRDTAEIFMASGVSWAWSSRTRDWTHLTRISLSAFLADAAQSVLLVGTEGDLPTGLDNEMVKDWLRRFARVEPVPLAAAVSLTPERQFLFVQQHASATVNVLVDALGIDRRAALRRAYARLGPASLEAVAERL